MDNIFNQASFKRNVWVKASAVMDLYNYTRRKHEEPITDSLALQAEQNKEERSIERITRIEHVYLRYVKTKLYGFIADIRMVHLYITSSYS